MNKTPRPPVSFMMGHICSEMLRELDGRVDGELSAAESGAVDAHLQTCDTCRAEFESRRALKRALQALKLPECPAIKTPLEHPARRRRLAAAAAAMFAIMALLVLWPSSVPNVVALTSRLHDQVLDGTLTPKALGLKVAIPGTQYVGDCACPAELGASSPFIVYRRGETPISLLILETEPGRLPDSAKRNAEGRDYYFFRANRNNAIVCQSGRLCHIWVSRLDEATLVQTILATREGRSLLSGEKLTLAGVTCSACCSMVESSVRGVEGVKDAAVNIHTMELVVTPDSGKVDLDKVIRAIREAGFDARKQ